MRLCRRSRLLSLRCGINGGCVIVEDTFSYLSFMLTYSAKEKKIMLQV